MKRRGFLGLFGATVAAGPKAVAKVAIPEGVSALSLAGLGSDYDGSDNIGGIVPQSKGWAPEALRKFMSMTAEQERRQMKELYVNSLDPDTHALKSMSLGRKMDLSRRRQFAAWKRDRPDYLDGIIKGWWD